MSHNWEHVAHHLRRGVCPTTNFASVSRSNSVAKSPSLSLHRLFKRQLIALSCGSPDWSCPGTRKKPNSSLTQTFPCPTIGNQPSKQASRTNQPSKHASKQPSDQPTKQAPSKQHMETRIRGITAGLNSLRPLHLKNGAWATSAPHPPLRARLAKLRRLHASGPKRKMRLPCDF